MNRAAAKIQRTYLALLLFNTLAASLIWGINTIFLLQAGLSNLEAFAANAFFTAGMLIFELPTGIIADLKGRRLSFLLGILTLIISTLLYLAMWQLSAPFWAWAVASLLLGLGFTFFSGATEAWLVDALADSGFKGKIEKVFAKGQIVTGAAMLVGSIGGGLIAQLTNLGVPYILRAAILVISFLIAFFLMRDQGFKPVKTKAGLLREVKVIFKNSLKYGLQNPHVHWLMLASPFVAGVGIYSFYALQPYLLQLWDDQGAYAIAGLSAALVAAAQIVGGLLAGRLSHLFARQTSVIFITTIASTACLFLMGLLTNFWVVIALVSIWGLLFAATTPIREAYINRLIPSKQRATVLSFDALLGSGGGVVAQPLLGKAADVWSYSTSYLWAGAFQALAIPLVWLAKRADTQNKAIDRS